MNQNSKHTTSDTTPGKARGRQKADTNLARPLAPGDTFMPHEHDEAPGRSGDDSSEGVATRDVIEQAHKDISNGLVDTDLRGTPANVPGPVTGTGKRDAPHAPAKRRSTSGSRQ